MANSKEFHSIKEYEVKNIDPTAFYIPEFLLADEEQFILSNIYSAPKHKWMQLRNRRLQEWGGISLNESMTQETIPEWLQTYVDKIDKLNLMASNRPNIVAVAEYKPGQGLTPHFDGSQFYPTIAIISLGSHIVLKFCEPISYNEDDSLAIKPVFSLLLEPRSLVVLQDKLFHHYMHGISEITEDSIDDSIKNLHMCSKNYENGSKVARNTRISLTIRHAQKAMLNIDLD